MAFLTSEAHVYRVDFNIQFVSLVEPLERIGEECLI